LLKFGAEHVASAEEAGLDGTLSKIEAAGRSRDIHFVEVIKKKDLTVFRWQRIDGFVDGGLFAALLQEELWTLARIRGLGDFVEGETGRRDAGEFGAVEVGGKGKEPGGEGRLLTPGGQIAKGAEEGLLCEVLSTGAIAGEAVGEVDEWSLPTANDALKGGSVAGEDKGYVALIVDGMQ
jgi:hypothetical protein